MEGQSGGGAEGHAVFGDTFSFVLGWAGKYDVYVLILTGMIQLDSHLYYMPYPP